MEEGKFCNSWSGKVEKKLFFSSALLAWLGCLPGLDLVSVFVIQKMRFLECFCVLCLIVAVGYAFESNEPQDKHHSSSEQGVFSFLHSLNEKIENVQNEFRFMSTSVRNFTRDMIYHLPKFIANRIIPPEEL